MEQTKNKGRILWMLEYLYKYTDEEHMVVGRRIEGDANEDNTKYDMASTMLSYIDVTSYGVNDGLYYVDDGYQKRRKVRCVSATTNCGNYLLIKK